MVNPRTDERPQAGPNESEVPPGSRNDAPQGHQQWLSRWRWPLLGFGGFLAVLIIGSGVLYWGANSGFAKTDQAQANGDLAPISPRANGTVVKVLVDARLGTILIDFTTVSPETSRLVSPAADQARGRLRQGAGALSETRGTCGPEPSAGSAPAVHVAVSGTCTVGQSAACPFGASWRLSDLSR